MQVACTFPGVDLPGETIEASFSSMRKQLEASRMQEARRWKVEEFDSSSNQFLTHLYMWGDPASG